MSVMTDPSYQAQVRDSNSVLVGIAQIRIAGQTSIRALGVPAATLAAAASSAVQAVGRSVSTADATDPLQFIVRPATIYTANAAANPITGITGASYSGAVDGCYIVRVGDKSAVADGTTVVTTTGKVTIWSTTGVWTEVTLTGFAGSSTAIDGLTIAMTLSASYKIGDTWVIPVVSGSAQATNQTGIISPYSMFKGATNSIGGLKDASWDPKIDSIQTLESGFPAQINDQIIAKVSAGIKFGAFEFNSTLALVLRGMLNSAMSTGDIQAVAAEVVFRTRGGSLITYWCPSCTLLDAPTIAPQNDFSTISWNLRVNDQIEAGNTAAAYAAWLRNSQMYYELGYTH